MLSSSETKALPLSSIALALGIFSSVILTTLAVINVKDHEEDTYTHEVALARDIVTQRLSAIDEVLHSMKVLFDASSHVDANEFRVLSEDALKRHKYISNLSYMPLVTDKQREQFEQKFQDEGYFTYSITERKNTRNVPASRRGRYLPIIYLEPFTPSSAAQLGYDLLSEKKNESYVMNAIDTSGSVILPAGEQKEKWRHTLVKPLYAGKDTPKTVTERRQNVNGLIALYVDSKTIIEDIKLSNNMGLTLESIPPLQAQPKQLLLRHMEGDGNSQGIMPLLSFSDKTPFSIGSLQFELTIEKQVTWSETAYALVVAAAMTGIIITMLLLLLAKNVKARSNELQRRNQEIKNLVAQRTRELAIEKDLAHITLATIGDGVITTDEKGAVDYINPAAEKITGWSLAEAVQKPIEDVFIVLDEKTKVLLNNPVQECLSKQTVVTLPEHCAIVNHSSETQAIEASVAPIVDDNNTVSGSVLVFHDVSKARQMAQQMTYQATHDALTGLPNRMLLMDRLKQALSRAPWNKKSVAVLFLDLDRFKIVNDTLGHDIGDLLLCQVAERMKDCIRNGDTISRLGGDEFVIVLTDLAAAEDANRVAEKIIDAFSRSFKLNEQEFYTTTSIGVSMFPVHGDDPATLMKNADIAMYQAKGSGRNNYLIYDEEMSSMDDQRLSLETELRQALEKGELELYYQPQVDLETGEINSAEALLRWNHSTQGLISPMSFVPLAEETGLIIPIGQWVMEEACKQVKAWQGEGRKPIRIAVNIAHRQFASGSLMLDVKRALSKSGLEARYLELELTEGILAEDSHNAIATLDELKQMGIKLSIDDFGTGYSSFAYLKRFPLNALKVDRCFVKDITQKSDDAAICSAIIAMAHNLNLSVVAEGVEDEDQLAFLKKHQCDYVQGFYYSRPVPAEDFFRLLAPDSNNCSSPNIAGD